MRIGFINTEARNGGATRAMLRTMAALRAQGHETVLITLSEDPPPDGPVVRIADRTSRGPGRVAGVAHYFYNGRYIGQNRTAVSNTLFWVPAAGLDLAEAVGRLGLDVLNLHWTSFFVSLRSLERLAGLPIPIVFTLHDMAYLTGGCHYTAGCRRFETDCQPCPQIRFDPLKVAKAVMKRRRALYASARPWAIAPSQWMLDQANASGLFEPGRCHRIANTLDTQTFAPQSRAAARRAFGIPAKARVVLFGAFDNREHRKGFDLLQAAMRDLAARPSKADAPLCVLGLGRHLPALGIDGVQVIEAGYIDDDARLAAAYSASDVVALSSREDNLPNIMIEAMACGTPVAGFNIGGLPDAVEDGVNGALAAPFAPEGLADAIERVLNADAPAMRRAARRSALKLTDEAQHARSYVEVFEAARREAGFVRLEGSPPHARGWRPASPEYRPTLTEIFGGWPAEALIRLRAMLR